MEEASQYLKSDFLLSLLGFAASLADVALDVWAVVSLYLDGSYISMVLLIFLLLGSSIILQMFSWIWYSDTSINLETSVEKFVKRKGLLGLFHIVLLGVFLRCAGVVEISICNLRQTESSRHYLATFLIHDLNMLRLMEAFFESTPQLVLMICTVIQKQDLQFVTVGKIAGCFATIACTMTFYHRSMRAFVPETSRMGWLASLVYFLWNLLLLTSRGVSLALFASALPCYIAIHFLCLWMLLVLWAWWQNTRFMDSKEGEWLYRATVGLIWYFSWFNVAGRKTRLKSSIYHLCIGLDMALLLTLWWGKLCMESAWQSPPLVSPYVLLVGVPVLYLLGIALKLFYYQKFHPKRPSMQFRTAQKPQPTAVVWVAACATTERDSSDTSEAEPEREASLQPQEQGIVAVHKRMRDMAVNFYY